MTRDRHDAALASTRVLVLLGNLLDEEVFERFANRVQGYELRASADEIAKQQLRCRFERQLERVPVLPEQRDAMHSRAMALERLGGQSADDQLPASDVERLKIRDPPVRDELALREYGDAITQRFGIRQHVRAEEDGASAIAQRQDEISHLAAAQRIEAGHRLVEKHDLGIVDERLRDADALNHPFRKLAKRQAPFAGHANLIEQRRHTPAPLRAVVAEQAGEVIEELFGSEVVVKVGAFGKVSDAALDVDVADGASENFSVAGCRVDQLHQQLEGGGLAGAVRAEKPEGFSLGDFQIQAVECPIRPGSPEPDRKILGQVLGADCQHAMRIIGRTPASESVLLESPCRCRRRGRGIRRTRPVPTRHASSKSAAPSFVPNVAHARDIRGRRGRNRVVALRRRRDGRARRHTRRAAMPTAA